MTAQSASCHAAFCYFLILCRFDTFFRDPPPNSWRAVASANRNADPTQLSPAFVWRTLIWANHKPEWRPLRPLTDFRSNCSRKANTLFTYRRIAADSRSSAVPSDRGARAPLLVGCSLGNFELSPDDGGVLLNEAEPLNADGRMNSITGRVLSIAAASVTNSGASSSRALHVELTSQQVSASLLSARKELEVAGFPPLLCLYSVFR